MVNRILLVLLLAGIIAGCKSGKKETSRLNIILFGYDSIACYYGNSTEMADLRYGRITDSLFMDTVLTNAKNEKPGLILLKPGGGAGVLGDWEQVDTLLKINNFKNRAIDTLDEKEQKFFNTTSIIPFLKEHQEPLKLLLPKDESAPVDVSSGKGLVVLFLDEHEVYAYNGINMKNGSKYTYKELGIYLAAHKSRAGFFVVIKPGDRGTYKSIIDMLDLMTVNKVKKYKMEDPTNEEQEFINELLNTKVK